MGFIFVIVGLLLIAGGVFSFAVSPVQEGAAIVAAILLVGGLVVLGIAWVASGVAALRAESGLIRGDIDKLFKVARSPVIDPPEPVSPSTTATVRCVNCGKINPATRKVCTCGKTLS